MTSYFQDAVPVMMPFYAEVLPLMNNWTCSVCLARMQQRPPVPWSIVYKGFNVLVLHAHLQIVTHALATLECYQATLKSTYTFFSGSSVLLPKLNESWMAVIRYTEAAALTLPILVPSTTLPQDWQMVSKKPRFFWFKKNLKTQKSKI